MPSHQEHFDKKKIRIISGISLLMGFSQASIMYVMSTYFAEAFHSENVGLFYAISYLVLLLSLFNLHKVVKVLGKANVFCLTVFAKVIVAALLVSTAPSLTGVMLLIAYMTFEGLEWVSLDAILETYSLDAESGRIRGKHLTILNAGFLLGPFVSTQLLAEYSFHGIFFFLLILNSFIFITALIKLRDVPNDFRKDVSVINMIKKVYQRKNIFHIYYIACVLDFFYALMVIYTPIYLRDLGLGWDQIGLIFTVMLVPFVILQYPMGVIADKKKNEGKLLVLGIMAMAFSTFAIYFLNSSDVLIWSLILFGTRLGAALVEVLRDSYFYKQIDGEDVDLINFFRTALPVGNIAAALISFVLLSFLPVKIIFVLVAMVVFSALIPAFKLIEDKFPQVGFLAKK